MTPEYSSASVLAGRGAGNIIDLHTHPDFSTRQRRRKAMQDAIRVFVGPEALQRAREWAIQHGDASAMAFELEVDPSLITWPEGRMLVLVPAGVRLSFAQVAAFASAWRRDGVIFGSIPHESSWPNLWPARRFGVVR